VKQENREPIFALFPETDENEAFSRKIVNAGPTSFDKKALDETWRLVIPD
jgi:hypothetical protein